MFKFLVKNKTKQKTSCKTPITEAAIIKSQVCVCCCCLLLLGSIKIVSIKQTNKQTKSRWTIDCHIDKIASQLTITTTNEKKKWKQPEWPDVLFVWFDLLPMFVCLTMAKYLFVCQKCFRLIIVEWISNSSSSKQQLFFSSFIKWKKRVEKKFFGLKNWPISLLNVVVFYIFIQASLSCPYFSSTVVDDDDDCCKWFFFFFLMWQIWNIGKQQAILGCQSFV